MKPLVRRVRDAFYGEPSKTVPWLCFVLGVSTGVLSRSPGWGLASALLSGQIWNHMSSRMVIEDSRLGSITLTCPQRDSDGNPQVWLTFDDGPGPETPRLLEILRRFEARATFFFVGQNVRDYPDIEGLRDQLKRDGHQVANHSWSHPNFLPLDAQACRREIEQTQDCLKRGFPDSTQPLFRPPFGYRTSTLFDCLKTAELKPIGWSLNSLDFLSGPTEELVARVNRRVSPGAIMLFHDGPQAKTRTCQALPSILAHLTSQGYRFAVPNPEDLT